MRKVLMAAMALALVAGLIGMGVYAKWSDTETSKGNYFQAGSLDLKVNGKDDPNVPVLIEAGNVFPGQTGSVKVTLENAGTLEGKAYLEIMNLSCDENGVIEPEVGDEPGKVELCDAILVTIGGVTRTLPDWEYQKVSLGGLAGSSSMTVTISWVIDKNAGPNIMTDKCTFDIKFSLEQP
jgi:predicted ribosomally synthesized peptide with SipW-like signal peptide